MKITDWIVTAWRIVVAQKHLPRDLTACRLLLGKQLARANAAGGVRSLAEAEFSVFSQFGEDGIIQYLVNRLEFPHHTFIEFGVEDYTESNTRFLLLNNNWSGFIMDSSAKYVARIRRREEYWKYDLRAIPAFVTRENINDLLAGSGFDRDVGLMSIDVDGNDYWIWRAVEVVRPIVVIVEYNSVWGGERAITVPYDEHFVRSRAHSSMMYYGASLRAFCELGRQKGYAFIGCNSNGNNAFFVRRDKLGALQERTPEEGYVESKFHDSRDENGGVSHLRGPERLRPMAGMPVINVLTQEREVL